MRYLNLFLKHYMIYKNTLLKTKLYRGSEPRSMIVSYSIDHHHCTWNMSIGALNPLEYTHQHMATDLSGPVLID